MGRDATPGRLQGRSGVLLSLGAAALALAACEAIGGGATLQLDSADVRLPAGAEIHEIRVSGAGAQDSLAPARVEVEPGDVIRFVAGDRRTHALAFEGEALPDGARELLERTSQLRGPPLVDDGAAWVVSLEDAPPGRYPFLCRTHGARGVVVVEGGN